MSATAFPPPEAQYMAALDRANVVRLYRAQVKRDIRAGRARITDLIADPDERLLAMPVYELLMSMHRVGHTKVQRLLTECGISMSKTIGGMTDRQRGALTLTLRRRWESGRVA